jgi:hypothetical protein
MWRSHGSRGGALSLALLCGLASGLAIGSDRGSRIPGAQQGIPLPPGKHQELVAGRCIICHSLEMVAQQRQDREGWEAILDRMISYGAPIPPEDRPAILEYLVTHLGQ